MDSNHHFHFNPTVGNQQAFEWFYNGDSSITSKSSVSPLISSVENYSFDEPLTNFINGVNYNDPYFDSGMGLIPAVYNHGEVEAYNQHYLHNHLHNSTNPGLTHFSNPTSVVDFNLLHSFEEFFPILEQDLVIHENVNIQHPVHEPIHKSVSQINGDDPSIVTIEDDRDEDGSHESHSKKQTANKKKANKKKYCNGKALLISFDEISQHFDVPITMAAKRLNVGLTALKKRCRELGIERWPHRKIQSLKTLIHNLKDEFGYCKELEMLEEHKKMMEKLPDMELTEETKRIRQACFKVNYKKRRSSLASSSSSSSPTVHSSMYSFSSPQSN